MTSTPELLHRAHKGLEGRHPTCDFPIKTGTQEATAHALVALAAEQQATNAHLASIADSLTRIADALHRPAVAPAPETEPKRRLWLPGRRNA
ncbi:hypothetical protein [Streptomyces asiaticus]|uniref:hypothetical protein n=1 Tax=Streptomyces asiaticus TaxID=114695 RepID=UPI003F671B62